MRQAVSIAILCAFAAIAAGLWAPAAAGEDHSVEALREALLFHASFDNGLDADFAAGDPVFYTAPGWSERNQREPGIQEGHLVEWAKNEGRTGSALRRMGSMDPVVFFRGGPNIGYSRDNWEGTVSVWMQIDPDEDLAPGWSDPLQLAGAEWSDGVMFFNFSRDETPRHFRLSMPPVRDLWNPEGTPWEEVPLDERPMTQTPNPPYFGSDRWTHCVFTFENVNTGEDDGVGRLYVNGDFIGEITGFDLRMDWGEEENDIVLGMHYVGLLDDLTVFNRALTREEVEALYTLEQGAAELHENDSE